MRAIKILLPIFLFAFFLDGFSNPKQNNKIPNNPNEWNGWRGGENSGVLESSNIPLRWSLTHNLKWKTNIIGKGYSSPIVSNDSIFLTTAYETTRWETIKKYIKVISYIFILITFLIFLNHLSKYRLIFLREKKSLFFSLVGYLMLIGFVFFGRSILDYSDKIDVRSWLSTCFQITLCASLTLSLTYERKHEFFMGLIFILFSVFCIIGMPPSTRSVILNVPFIINAPLKELAYLMSPVILFVVGLLLILNVQITTKYNIVWIRKKSVIYYVLYSVLIAFILYIIFRLVRSDLFEKYISGTMDFQPYFGWLFTILFFSICIVFLFFNTTLKKRFSNSIILLFVYRIILVALGIMIFNNYYFISSNTSFIRSILSINKNDGSTNWVCDGVIAEHSTMSTYNSAATPTPVYDDLRVYAYFGSAGLVCSNFEGELLWVNRELRYENVYGVAVSPIICEELVIIVADLYIGAYIAVVNSKTGKKVWSKKRDDTFHHNGYNRTPICKKYMNKNVVFVYGTNSLIAYEVKSGDIVQEWEMPDESGDAVIAPIFDKELNLYFASKKQVYCFNLNTSKIEWYTKVRDGPNCSTPVLFNGLLFMISERGNILCLDANSGKQFYKKKLKGTYFSSPVITNNQIIFCSYQGLVTVIEAKRNFKKLFECNLNEKILATPAITNQQLLIRTESMLYCIQKDY